MKVRPWTVRFTQLRKESDKVSDLCQVVLKEKKLLGTIPNFDHNFYTEDKKSRNYGSIKNKFRPGHADSYLLFKNMVL